MYLFSAAVVGAYIDPWSPFLFLFWATLIQNNLYLNLWLYHIQSAASLIYSQKSVYLLVVAAAGAYIDPWSPFKAAFVKASNLPPPLCGNFQPWKIGIQGGFGRIFSYVYYGILTGPRPYQLLSTEWRYASSSGLSMTSLLEVKLADLFVCL